MNDIYQSYSLLLIGFVNQPVNQGVNLEFYFSMTNSFTNRQLIFSDENNEKASISVTIVEVFMNEK